MWLCSKNQGFSGILGLVVVLVFELLDTTETLILEVFNQLRQGKLYVLQSYQQENGAESKGHSNFPLLVETTSFAVTFIIICRKLIDHFNDPVWEPLIDDGDYGYMNKENQL